MLSNLLDTTQQLFKNYVKKYNEKTNTPKPKVSKIKSTKCNIRETYHTCPSSTLTCNTRLGTTWLSILTYRKPTSVPNLQRNKIITLVIRRALYNQERWNTGIWIFGQTQNVQLTFVN